MATAGVTAINGQTQSLSLIGDISLKRLLRDMLVNSGRVSRCIERWFVDNPEANQIPAQVGWAIEYQARVALALMKEQRERDKMSPSQQVLSEAEYRAAVVELEDELVSKMSTEKLQAALEARK